MDWPSAKFGKSEAAALQLPKEGVCCYCGRLWHPAQQCELMLKRYGDKLGMKIHYKAYHDSLKNHISHEFQAAYQRARNRPFMNEFAGK